MEDFVVDLHHLMIVIRVTIDTTLAIIQSTLEDDGNVILVDLPLHLTIVNFMTMTGDHHHHCTTRHAVLYSFGVVFRKNESHPVDVENMAATVVIQVPLHTVLIPSKKNGPTVIVTVPSVGRLVPILRIQSTVKERKLLLKVEMVERVVAVEVEMEEVVIDQVTTIDARIVTDVAVLTGNGTDEAVVMKDDHPSVVVVVITTVIIPMIIRRLLLIPAVRLPCRRRRHHHHQTMFRKRTVAALPEEETRPNLLCPRIKERSLFRN
jgi:hypothetical protein